MNGCLVERGLLREDTPEQTAALAAWRRFLTGRPGWKEPRDRALVARALVNLAWRHGDMAAVLELAEALEGESL